MSDAVKFSNVEDKIIPIRETQVILDSDVAVLYDVQTKEINQAVKNNPDKFPKGYIFELDNKEIINLRSKFLTENLTKTRVAPKAFTEKWLYMLATIVKGIKATQTSNQKRDTRDFHILMQASHGFHFIAMNGMNNRTGSQEQ
ncbi:hypothetical protein EZS27_041844 [termite gut metagenome]|uniref:KilA-N DNA-binding domain-containing protein n=1 Tax=termite gut metagenome TaxID=433724 RepID=A0A5J4PC34_9ZZZZ